MPTVIDIACTTMVGEAALPNNTEKGRSGKRKTKLCRPSKQHVERG